MTSQPVPLKFQNSWSIKEKMTWTTREGWTMSTSAHYFFFFSRGCYLVGIIKLLIYFEVTTFQRSKHFLMVL